MIAVLTKQLIAVPSIQEVNAASTAVPIPAVEIRKIPAAGAKIHAAVKRTAQAEILLVAVGVAEVARRVLLVRVASSEMSSAMRAKVVRARETLAATIRSEDRG
jgi:hypothetical protein